MNSEKANAKYKSTGYKKRQEKLFEEREMVTVYLRRKKSQLEHTAS